MSFLARVHRALAEFTASHSSFCTYSLFSASHSSFCIRMGRLMWSEYLPMICLSFQWLRYSVASSRRCRMTLVPRAARVDGFDLEVAGAAADPAHALGGFAGRRGGSTVILSATMKPE
jgi:hypothetical protein